MLIRISSRTTGKNNLFSEFQMPALLKLLKNSTDLRIAEKPGSG